MLTEPHHGPDGRRAWIVGLVVALLVIGMGAWLLLDRSADAPEPASAPPEASAAEPSEEHNAAAASAERAVPPASAPRTESRAPRASAAPSDGTTATPPPVSAAPSLRVDSDVAGAMVFLNRKYLGTTPLLSRDVTPGSHQLNVQVEGREPVVQTIEVADRGETRVAVDLAAARLNARVPVVHKHGVGSCDGILSATPAGLRYQTAHDKDGFVLSFAQVETFSVDYLEKRLRVKQRGGRTWNFTTKDDNADPLFVFHREVEAAR